MRREKYREALDTYRRRPGDPQARLQVARAAALAGFWRARIHPAEVSALDLADIVASPLLRVLLTPVQRPLGVALDQIRLDAVPE